MNSLLFIRSALLITLVLCGAIIPLHAQFSFNGQLIQRGEYRAGYGKMIADGADPAAFISQRFRLQGAYQLDKVTLFASVQDIRTWGSTGQTNISDDLLSVHEAWMEIHFDSAWSLKTGRQELNYDNARFLGNLDWAMQARSHDFGLIRYERKKMKLHFGAGYNQNGEALNGNVFTVSNQYKTAQLIRYENEYGKFAFSVLLWNNGKQFTETDTNNVITRKGIRYSQTIGAPLLRYTNGNLALSGFFYYQAGRDVSNRKLSAFDASLQASYLLHANAEKKNQLRITLGAEMISGTSNRETAAVNSSFSPMYGTNHTHNGYMDLFYVGGRHENSVGLTNVFLLAKFECNPSLFVSVNGHYFRTFADYYSGSEKQDPLLGTEIDFSCGFVLTPSVSFQAGYSQLFAGSTLEKLQGVDRPQPTQNWAYLMIIVRPAKDKKFIGLLF